MDYTNCCCVAMATVESPQQINCYGSSVIVAAVQPPGQVGRCGCCIAVATVESPQQIGC